MNYDFRSSFVSEQEKKPIATLLEDYREYLAALSDATDYVSPEASIQVPYDVSLLTNVVRVAKTFKTKALQHVVVIGIGGSNLGTQAISEALPHKGPKLHFLDTVSPTSFTRLLSLLQSCSSKEAFLLISISKSGGTTETAANTEALLAALKKPFGKLTDRLVVITGNNSPYWKSATSQGVTCLDLPETVGGRFSVFSAVGLFPLALCGINIKELFEGAREAIVTGTRGRFVQNMALQQAAITYLHLKRGRTIRNLFFFAPELESLGKWERQLIAESLGKQGEGILPIVSIGSTDMHSMAQLYFGGPDTILTHLITTPPSTSPRLPVHLTFPELVDNLASKSLSELMEAIAAGTKTAYKKLKRPAIHVTFDQLNERELGSYMQTRMLEVMYLGHLLGINPFDQPMVEVYKKETRQLLKKQT